MSCHVYQSSQGGKTYVPLEQEARILQDATPKFTRSISSKYSQLSTRQVVSDLQENHGRKISRDYVQVLSDKIGSQIELSESRWSYSLADDVVEQTQTIGIGRDGTTTHIRGEGYRETMSGTICFYDKDGERLHTVYQAQAPEYNRHGMGNLHSINVLLIR